VHRRLVIQSGSREGSLRDAEAVVRERGADAVVVRVASDADRATLRALLGREADAAIVDLHPGLDPDVLGAAHGVVRGGGLLVLCTPPLTEWAAVRGPVEERMAVWPYQTRNVGTRFVHRLVKLATGRTGQNLTAVGGQGATQRDGPTRGQVEVVEAIARGGVVVVTADRGRGKSAALGMAAREVVGSVDRVIVTGPSWTAVEVLLRFAGDAPRVRFLPAEEAARSCTAHDALFVDEAAALPIPLLRRLARRTGRLALATTVHGYEGTGRGFLLRFVETLRAQHPGLVQVHLDEPVRWSAGDPVEAFVHRLLALDAEPCEVDIGTWSECPPDVLGREVLAGDEGLLRAVFGLLVHAHYRTTPSDLRRLLDAPNLSVHVVREGGAVTAAAVVAEEGGLDAERVAALASGAERIRGHAIPETLVCHLGRADAGALRVCRVTRIAVHPELRGRGLGSTLLAHVADHARARGAELCGSVFGATPELLRFWERAGYTTVRFSASRSARSGEHSALVLCPLAPAAAQLVTDLRARFAADLPYALADTLRTLDPALLPSTDCALGPGPSAHLVRYARGIGVYDSVVGEVWALCAREVRGLPAVLVRKVLQRWSWEEVAEERGVSVPVAMRAVRAAVAELLRARGAVTAPR
jgi:tRNA(Met) cytidine acetyltransferase